MMAPTAGWGNADPVLVEHPRQLVPAGPALDVVELSGHRLHEDAFLEECLGLGRQWLLQGRLTSAESVSLELFKTGLQLARGDFLPVLRLALLPCD